MRVFLDEALFEGEAAEDPLPLTSLISLAREGRHRVLLHPAFRPDDERELPRNRWLGERDQRLRSRLTELLRISALEASTDRPEAPRVTVVDGETSDWAGGRLCATDALKLLRAPLRILLENGRNDWSFLVALVDRVHRQALRRAEREQWLAVHNGNGIGGIKKSLEMLTDSTSRDTGWQIERLRTWVMFDRDAHPDDPLAPSRTSTEVRQLCGHESLQGPWPFPYLQLPRRTIESYIPVEALDGRASLENGVDRLAALGRLREQHVAESFAYDMKQGFIKDTGLQKPRRHELRQQWRGTASIEQRRALTPHDELHETWRALPAELVSDLLFGFGSDVAELAYGKCDAEPLWDEWFLREHARGPEGQPSRADVATLVLELI